MQWEVLECAVHKYSKSCATRKCPQLCHLLRMRSALVLLLSVLVVQVCQVLQSTCKKEGLSLPPDLARRVAEYSGRNLRKALLACEACRVQQSVLRVAHPVTYVCV